MNLNIGKTKKYIPLKKYINKKDLRFTSINVDNLNKLGSMKKKVNKSLLNKNKYQISMVKQFSINKSNNIFENGKFDTKKYLKLGFRKGNTNKFKINLVKIHLNNQKFYNFFNNNETFILYKYDNNIKIKKYFSGKNFNKKLNICLNAGLNLEDVNYIKNSIKNNDKYFIELLNEVDDKNIIGKWEFIKNVINDIKIIRKLT